MKDKSILPEDPEYSLGWWVFKLPKTHPFYVAACYHDYAYTTHKSCYSGLDITRKEADDRFYRMCLDQIQWAQGTYIPPLKTQAVLFYGIVKATGWMFW